jgi:hypothetical protein
MASVGQRHGDVNAGGGRQQFFEPWPIHNQARASIEARLFTIVRQQQNAAQKSRIW